VIWVLYGLKQECGGKAYQEPNMFYRGWWQWKSADSWRFEDPSRTRFDECVSGSVLRSLKVFIGCGLSFRRRSGWGREGRDRSA